MRDIIHYGTLAPSAHNNQPWRFRHHENRIEVLLDEDRLIPAMDPLNEQCYISLGAAIENIRLAARHQGFAPQITCFPDPEQPQLAAVVDLQPGSPAQPQEESWFQAIPRRVTVRKPYPRQPLPVSMLNAWKEIAAAEGVQLRLVTDAGQINNIARVIGKGDRLCFNQADVQREVYKWMRFSKHDVETKRDGLWINTFAFDPVSRLSAPVLLRWEMMNMLNRVGVNRMLGLRTKRMARQASAFAMLTIPGYRLQSLVAGGQVFQRLALHATEAGIGFHPMSSALILCRLLQLNPGLFSPDRANQIVGLRSELQDAFGFSDEDGIVLLFRIGYTEPLRDREPRRDLADMLDSV